MSTNKKPTKKNKLDVKSSPKSPPNESKGLHKTKKDPDAVSEEDVLGTNELKNIVDVFTKRKEGHGKYQVGTFRKKE